MDFGIVVSIFVVKGAVLKLELAINKDTVVIKGVIMKDSFLCPLVLKDFSMANCTLRNKIFNTLMLLAFFIYSKNT